MSLLLQSRDDRGDTEGARMKQHHPPDDQGHEDDEEGDDSPDRLSGSASSRGSRNSVADDFVMVPNLVSDVWRKCINVLQEHLVLTEFIGPLLLVRKQEGYVVSEALLAFYTGLGSLERDFKLLVPVSNRAAT